MDIGASKVGKWWRFCRKCRSGRIFGWAVVQEVEGLSGDERLGEGSDGW